MIKMEHVDDDSDFITNLVTMHEIDGIMKMVGPCRFYTSGMYHYGPGENDYYHLMMAAVKAEPIV